MKKIFTFILLAISTLAMAQAFPGDPGRVAAAGDGYNHDLLNYSWIITNGEDWGEDGAALGATISTEAEFSAYVGYNATHTCMQFYSYHGIGINKSAGYVRVLTIDWNSNSTANSELRIYGYANAISSDEDIFAAEIENPTGTLIGSIPAGQSNFDITSNYRYIVIVGGNEPLINSIDFAWEQVLTYNITTQKTGSGNITVDATAASGANVNVTIQGSTGMKKTELMSYKVYKNGDPTTIIKGVTLTEAEYTSDPVSFKFTMPAHDVVVAAEFQNRPQRATNNTTVSNLNGCVDPATKTINLVSGQSYNFTYIIDNASAAMQVTIAKEQKSKMSNHNYNVGTHSGTFTLKAYDQGTTDISFTTTQSNSYSATTTTYTINVVPREVVLISRASDGNYYAVGNTLSNGMMEAVQVVKIDGDRFAVLGGSKTNLKWLVCSLYDEERDQFTIQSGTATSVNKKYLQFTDADLDFARFGNTSFSWYKQGKGFMTKKTEISWSEADGKYTARIYNYEVEGAYEVDFANLIEAPERTLRSNLTPDAFSTVCMPYSFIAGDGLTVYTIDNKEVKGDGTHIFFCPVDSGALTEAGRPYIIQSTSATAQAYQIGDASASAIDNHDGLYGVMTNTYWSALWDGGNSTRFYNGNVLVFKGGSLAYVEYDPARGGGGGIAGNSACILLDEISTTSTCDDGLGGAAPRRISLAIQQPQTPTAVENILSADHINWNEPVYNVMGQRVARGTTGVLVQNGQKFIAL